MLCVLTRIASSRRFYCVHSTYNHCVENRKDYPKLSLFASWSGDMINPQWLELPVSRTNFHGPKDVRAIEVRLYLLLFYQLQYVSSPVSFFYHHYNCPIRRDFIKLSLMFSFFCVCFVSSFVSISILLKCISDCSCSPHHENMPI